MYTLVRWVFLVSLFGLLTACFSFGGEEHEVLPDDDGEKHFYIIDVDRGSVAEEFVRDRVLLLKPVRVVPYFKKANLVIRVDENEYQPLPNHQFVVEPVDMMTDQLRRWLLKTGLFSQVLIDQGQVAEADYILESAVTALFIESRPSYSPQATLEMQFFMNLADEANQNVAFQTGLRVDVDLDKATPAKAVTGWKQGLTELLFTLEEDLSGYFSKVASP